MFHTPENIEGHLNVSTVAQSVEGSLGGLTESVVDTQDQAGQIPNTFNEVKKIRWKVDDEYYHVRIATDVSQPNGRFYLDILAMDSKPIDSNAYTIISAICPSDIFPQRSSGRWLLHEHDHYRLNFLDAQLSVNYTSITSKEYRQPRFDSPPFPMDIAISDDTKPPEVSCKFVYATEESIKVFSFNEIAQSPSQTPSEDEIKFDDTVNSLLASNHKHSDLKLRLRNLVLEKAQKVPLVKVVICQSFGEFAFSDEFLAFRPSIASFYTEQGVWRHEPSVINAIIDFGRFICEKCPYILQDMRTMRRWNLPEVMRYSRHPSNLRPGFSCDPDLRIKAEAYAKEMITESGYWRCEKLPSISNNVRVNYMTDNENNLVAFAERHPTLWMVHKSLPIDRYSKEGSAIHFAHTLLQTDFAQYHVDPDDERDLKIFGYIGLLGASTSGCRLAFAEIPAFVDYKIIEHGGLEEVEY